MSTKSPADSSGICDNHHHGKVVDFLVGNISEESELSVVSAYFMINIYDGLSEQLEQVRSLCFLSE